MASNENIIQEMKRNLDHKDVSLRILNEFLTFKSEVQKYFAEIQANYFIDNSVMNPQRLRSSTGQNEFCLNGIETLHEEVIQENLELIVDDLNLKEGPLVDHLIEESCLSGEEVAVLKPLDRRTQNMHLGLKLSQRSKEKFHRFVKLLRKDYFHVHKKLSESYDAKLKAGTHISQCVICAIKKNVEIPHVIVKLCAKKVVNMDFLGKYKSSFHLLNQSDLWEIIFKIIDKAKNRRDKIKVLQEVLSQKYEHLSARLNLYLPKLECQCYRNSTAQQLSQMSTVSSDQYALSQHADTIASRSELLSTSHTDGRNITDQQLSEDPAARIDESANESSGELFKESRMPIGSSEKMQLVKDWVWKSYIDTTKLLVTRKEITCDHTNKPTPGKSISQPYIGPANVPSSQQCGDSSDSCSSVETVQDRTIDSKIKTNSKTVDSNKRNYSYRDEQNINHVGYDERGDKSFEASGNHTDDTNKFTPKTLNVVPDHSSNPKQLSTPDDACGGQELTSKNSKKRQRRKKKKKRGKMDNAETERVDSTNQETFAVTGCLDNLNQGQEGNKVPLNAVHNGIDLLAQILDVPSLPLSGEDDNDSNSVSTSENRSLENPIDVTKPQILTPSNSVDPSSSGIKKQTDYVSPTYRKKKKKQSGKRKDDSSLWYR